MRKDLFTVTSKITELGFPWGLVTNGYLVTREIVEKCRKTGMKTVLISIDGLEDDHCWLRRNKQSFTRAIKAVRCFRTADFLSILEVSTAVSRRIIDRLPYIYELLGKENIDEWRLIAVFPGGRARDNKEVLLQENDYRKLYSFLKEIRKKSTSFKISGGEEGYLGCEFEREVRDDYYHCSAGIQVAGILSNGDISACPSISRRLVQGNIRNESLAGCWENKFQIFRDRKWMRQGLCKSCAHWWMCRGNSLHLWNFDKNEPSVCHYKALYGEEALRCY